MKVCLSARVRLSNRFVENVLSSKLELRGDPIPCIEAHTANLLVDGHTILVFGGALDDDYSNAGNEVFLLDFGTSFPTYATIALRLILSIRR